MKILTTVALALSLLSSSSLWGEDRVVKEGGPRVEFSAEVLSISIAKRSLASRRKIFRYDLKKVPSAGKQTIVVGFDARWTVELKITDSKDGDLRFTKGEKVSFIVSSPTRVLGHRAGIDQKTGSYRAIGKNLDFELLGSKKDDGKVLFSILRVVQKKDTGGRKNVAKENR